MRKFTSTAEALGSPVLPIQEMLPTCGMGTVLGGLRRHVVMLEPQVLGKREEWWSDALSTITD